MHIPFNFFKKFPRNVFTVFEEPIRSEMFSAAHLERHGESLAKAQEVSLDPSWGVNLASRVAENENVLIESYKSIVEAVREQRAITPAAEWLIDNFHIVEEQLRDIRDHLPPEYYWELPKLTAEHLFGYPRVYGIAWAFVAHTDSLFDPELLKHFVKSYQKVQPLTIGELWAISITLRVVMIENLRRLSARIVGSQRARKEADKIADEILGLGGQSPRPTAEILKGLSRLPLRGGFAVQLVQRLRFQESKVAPILKWLEIRLADNGLEADKIVSEEHNSQTAANASVRNIITSMRLISALDWRIFFEEVSLVDETLRAHPNYSQMDFITRDRYRHGLEELARGSKVAEIEVAQAVFKKTEVIRKGFIRDGKPLEEKRVDLGYYLISRGRPEFEKEIGFRMSLKNHFLRWYVSNGQLIYIGSIFLLTQSLLLLGLRSIDFSSSDPRVYFFLAFLGAFPASDLALTIINRLTIAILGPRHMPRLKLSSGVPTHLKTFIVVPTMLLYESEIANQVEQLEVHFLSNPDGALHFALLSDWKDSPSEIFPSDQRLLESAIEKMSALNDKYGPSPDGKNRFFVFHRRRKWNPGENKWIGWERKRGKLHEFNRYLRGAKDTSFIVSESMPLDIPMDVRYVITLDADTKLPKGAVAQLVGTIAHPLNNAIFDTRLNRVIEGYGILQPRITPSLPATQDSTLFQRLSSGPCGIDPYASAVSDVYQDLFAEGSYTGKGIYDVDIFERALEGRIPENRLLSHDLFEGNFARCGLLSDVEFFEDFPSHSEVAVSRVHRWTRGDWQLLPWILGREGRSISLIGRWKMFDNIRRSLAVPMTLFLFVAIFYIPGLKVSPWIALNLVSLGLPPLLPFFSSLLSFQKRISTKQQLRGAAEELVLGLGRFLLNIVLLPYHSWIYLDAIGRTLIRLFISKRNLLEWTTAAQSKSTASLTLFSFARRMFSVEVCILIFAAAVFRLNQSQLGSALPFIILWLASPVLAWQISLPPSKDKVKPLEVEDVLILRNTARKIWRFFVTFVTAGEKHLPPDNFQEEPQPIVAHRSSPTNFGLYLLSTIAARDFGWIGVQEMVDRLEATLQSMMTLPRHHGHFFNWYETTDGRALEPKYISSIDNGNLAGHLLVVAQTCEETLRAPAITNDVFFGATDALRLLRQSLIDSQTADDKRNLTVDQIQITTAAIELEKLLLIPFDEIPDQISHWELLLTKAVTLVDVAKAFADERGETKNSEIFHWSNALENEIKSHVRDFYLFNSWSSFASTSEISPWRSIDDLLAKPVSLENLANHCGSVITHLVALRKEGKQSGKNTLPPYTEALLESLETSITASNAISKKLVEIAGICRQLFNEMNFNFLYDSSRKLFSIGYRMVDSSLDAGYYDLLASEARLLSFIAIAKGDVSAGHWFRLGRALTPVEKGAALISWSGSMFEYLMPSLVMNTPAASLLDQTCRLVVRKQILYGEERAVPWGISESAYNARDVHLTYQYSNFGVPELGLKRGLGQDLVIAPYATILAAMYDPVSAVKNLRRLAGLKAEGVFGFYESIDFTASRLPEGEEQAVVKTYMAHHQGMSLVAIANVLHGGKIRKRFHLEPIVQATELLLQERTPRNIPFAKSRLESVDAGLVSEESPTTARRYHSPGHSVPRTHLLSNGHYAVMVTNSGSGYSRFLDLSVTRWREDVTRDHYGSYIYIRDVESSQIWSAGYQPTCVEADRYEAVFMEDRVRFTRDDGTITSHLEIFLSPEDNAEIRRLSITNNGSEARELEVTSYSEVVLNTQGADVVHPTFSNLFVQTEYAPDITALVATRRPRSKNEPRIWLAHVIATDSNTIGEIEYETDRARFIGRGHNVSNPVSIFDGKPLSNTVGSVLDPIVSLRTRVRIEPGATSHVTYSTVIASEKSEVLSLADKFHDAPTFERASNLAWTQAQVKLHYLGIQHDEANLFQQLANRVLYLDRSLRPSSDMLKRNTRDVTGLWAHGISGDYPIVLVRIDDVEDRGIIRQLLRAHEYWGTKRLIVDLIILNEKASTYAQDLQESLETMVRGSSVTSGSYLPSSKGKVFILRADIISSQDRDLLQYAARAILVARQGSLAEQVKRMTRKEEKQLKTPRIALFKTNFSQIPMAVPKLEFFNGLGGFADNGKEYVIYLKKGQSTPAPWINVIANSQFGFHVSENGAGSSWSLNSRENQITPWSNDPVSDPTGECFYIFDKDSGALWSPTASPIRNEDGEYVTRHGQGYSRFETSNQGIYSSLTQFVHWTEPVKISRLTIRNNSTTKRNLSVTGFVEWVLGFSRTITAPYIVTEFDEKTGVVMAHNPWNAEFGKRFSFCTFVGGNDALTCDRTEFLGRNGQHSKPLGLVQEDLFSGKVGAGLDPCAALQKDVLIDVGQEVTLNFILGQSETREKALSLIQKISADTIESIFTEVIDEWDKILTKIQVETPDSSMNYLLNRWLLYQTTVCRMWSRAAFYQAGGAFGFRDQLQDSMALVWAKPEWTKRQILLAASRQFLEGDVQHWWHIPNGRGVRTRISDDLLWLPFVVNYYIKISQDDNILDIEVPFLNGDHLKPGQEDSYYTPEVSSECGSVYEHCARALDHSLKTGQHGLPLMGSGDWNDGMNRVGHEGKGESVWLAWFLYANLTAFSYVAQERGDRERVEKWTDHAAKIKNAVEETAWDGAWYRRAYFDDGTPLGSSANIECRIDSIAQTWGVISGAANRQRVERAMESVEEFLIRPADELVLLFSPPFNKTPLDPGYIKGYLPGVRENGGQYSHAAMWCIFAYAGLNKGQSAVDLFSMLNPINHSSSRAGVHRYKVEPYVIAADVYSEEPYVGRGGWTWYTGSSAWMYRAGIEAILGLKISGNKLLLEPHIHPEWKTYKIFYRHGKTDYNIEVKNPKALSSGTFAAINLMDDGEKHMVELELKPPVAP